MNSFKTTIKKKTRHYFDKHTTHFLICLDIGTLLLIIKVYQKKQQENQTHNQTAQIQQDLSLPTNQLPTNSTSENLQLQLCDLEPSLFVRSTGSRDLRDMKTSTND